MEELKENMYIMSNDRLRIGIVKLIENNIPVIVVNGKLEWLQFCGMFWNRKSASFNIIDLLIPGDYVNGYKVISKKPLLMRSKQYRIQIFKNHIITLNKSQIKSIITKEQFASMEYVVNEKSNK